MFHKLLAAFAVMFFALTVDPAQAASPVKVSGVMAVGGNAFSNEFAIAPGVVKRAIFITDRKTDAVGE